MVLDVASSSLSVNWTFFKAIKTQRIALGFFMPRAIKNYYVGIEGSEIKLRTQRALFCLPVSCHKPNLKIRLYGSSKSQRNLLRFAFGWQSVFFVPVRL